MKYPACSVALNLPPFSRSASFASKKSFICGRIGNTVGMCSWNRVSTASTATAGAASVLALFPSDMNGTRCSLPSPGRTYSTRSGWVFADVGAHLASSQMEVSSSSVTGVSAQVFAVLASVNSSDRPASSSVPEYRAFQRSCHETPLSCEPDR